MPLKSSTACALIPELRHERQAEPMVASGEKPLLVVSNVAGQVADKLVDVVDALLAGVVAGPRRAKLLLLRFLITLEHDGSITRSKPPHGSAMQRLTA